MLTQEQANDLNLQLHKQEAAEIGLNKVNQDLEKYTDMIRRVADMMKTATPEQKERIRSIAPRLLEEYNNLKLKKSTYEDSYREAISKINEYNTLNAQQPQVTNQTKRRTINTNGIDTTGWTTLPDGTKVSPDGRATVSPDGQVSMGVGIEQTFPSTYGVNAMMDNTNGNASASSYINGVNAAINGVNAAFDGASIETPTFTPIQTSLDRYGYRSNLFTPRYQGTYRYTNPTTTSGRRNNGNGGNGR